MHFFLLRSAVALALISCLVSPCYAKPARRALTAVETAALVKPIDLGKRIFSALSRYFDRPQRNMPSGGTDLLTSFPTVDLLRAGGYIAESDMRLVKQYRVAIPPVIFKPTDPVLIMQTSHGELSFDTQGKITLQETR